MQLIQGSFGKKGNFELVRRLDDRLTLYWRKNDGDVYPWHPRGEPGKRLFGSDVDSEPTFIQGNYGIKGNFELVVREGDRLRHYWRNNDVEGYPWKKGAIFGSGATSAPALIQSNYGNKGNFELVVQEGSQLRHYWRRNDEPGTPWYKGVLFGHDVDSAPALIQSNIGRRGNLEVVVREGNKLRHYWRNNDAEDVPWEEGDLFGNKIASAPALIQSNYGRQGNFEVVVREGDGLRLYWRDNDAAKPRWRKGQRWSSHITSRPTLIQSNYGRKGNFEVVATRGSCLVHFWRNNDDPDRPWSIEIPLHAEVPWGDPPNEDQIDYFTKKFPRLRNFHITGPATAAYNCVAWSVGLMGENILPDPDVDWFDDFYRSHGWRPARNGEREHHKRKIALYNLDTAFHVSLETTDCDWHESKVGWEALIMHGKHDLEGGPVYGNIIKYYEKDDPAANEDLA